MLDPLSIATACVSITGGLTTLMMRIGVFVSEVKSARKDMDAVHRELSSLELCLNALRIEELSGRSTIPADLRDQVKQILVNIEMTINQIGDMLIKLGSGKLGRRVQWAMTEKNEMNKLRSSLESNKAALEIALSVGTISILVEQRERSKRQDGHMVDMTQMMKIMTVQSTEMSDKIDDILSLQRQKLGLTDIQAVLDELKSEIKILAGSENRNSILQNFSGQAMAHVETLLVPVSNEVGTNVLGVPEATTTEPSRKGLAGRTARNSEPRSMKSRGTCVACKQDLSVPGSWDEMREYQEMRNAETESLKEHVTAVNDEMKGFHAFHRGEIKIWKELMAAADHKNTELEEKLGEQEQVINELATDLLSREQVSFPEGQSDPGRKVESLHVDRRKPELKQQSRQSITREEKRPQEVSVVGIPSPSQAGSLSPDYLHPFDYDARKKVDITRPFADLTTRAGKQVLMVFKLLPFKSGDSSLTIKLVSYMTHAAAENGILLGEGDSLVNDRREADLLFRPPLSVGGPEPVTLRSLADELAVQLLDDPAVGIQQIGARIIEKDFMICAIRVTGDKNSYICDHDVLYVKNNGSMGVWKASYTSLLSRDVEMPRYIDWVKDTYYLNIVVPSYDVPHEASR